MSDTDAELDRLHDLLNAIPAERNGMTIAELDGYVAALIVCPEMILPSEWLPGVWGGEHEFADVAEAEATMAAVMGHYNRIAGAGVCSRRITHRSWSRLARRREPRHHHAIRASPMRLRPDAWEGSPE